MSPHLESEIKEEVAQVAAELAVNITVGYKPVESAEKGGNNDNPSRYLSRYSYCGFI